MRKLIILTIIISTMFLFTGCGNSSIGYWMIEKIEAGDVVMAPKDAEALDLHLGSFKLNKSGSCVVEILEEKNTGKWTEKDGKITVKYGDRVAKGKRKGKNIVLTDDLTVVYHLHNSLA